MSEVISEHMTVHKFFQELVQQQCGTEFSIVQDNRFKIMGDGSGQFSTYKITCPKTEIASLQNFTISFEAPVSRVNGDEMGCEEIKSYEVMVEGDFAGQIEVAAKTCDTEGLCSEYTDQVYIEIK